MKVTVQSVYSVDAFEDISPSEFTTHNAASWYVWLIDNTKYSYELDALAEKLDDAGAYCPVQVEVSHD